MSKPRLQTLFLLLALMPLTGCAFRSYKVDRQVSLVPLKEATQEQLVEFINRSAQQLQSLNANIDIDFSVGGPKKGVVNDYVGIGGFLLVRKPEMLRMIGLVPVVRNRAFDMVSNGKSFELSVPSSNKFYVGSNQVGKPSPKPIENLRPRHILDAVLLREIDPETEVAVVRDGSERVMDPKTHKEVGQPDYVVVVDRREEGRWYLARQIVFSRVDLLPHRQLIYNPQGHVITDARYDNFTDTYGGIPFPSMIRIERPIEEYTIQLSIGKLRLNGPLDDAQFVLARPEGSQLVNLDENGSATAQNAETPIGRSKELHSKGLQLKEDRPRGSQE